MAAIILTQEENAIRDRIIKAASEGRTLYYSELTDGADASSRERLGQILERITRYDMEHKQPILSSIVILKATELPSEGFFELCDTLGIDAYLSELQRECFEYWRIYN